MSVLVGVMVGMLALWAGGPGIDIRSSLVQWLACSPHGREVPGLTPGLAPSMVIITNCLEQHETHIYFFKFFLPGNYILKLN